MTLSAYVSGVGVVGPGIGDWREAAAIMSGRVAYVPARTVLPVATLLPPAERRRTGRVVKLALAVAWEAATHAKMQPAQLASVFSSSGGDGDNCHELCQALALEGREISPTKFANSVHNAAAGYWSIATGAKMESSVLCAFDASFSAGMLEAMSHVNVDLEAVLLVTYDTEYPEPIHATRAIPDAFGCAMVLTPHRTPTSLARIELTLKDGCEDSMTDAGLEDLRSSIPAARCLPLLRQLALGSAARVVLDYLDASRVVLDVQPCV